MTKLRFDCFSQLLLFSVVIVRSPFVTAISPQDRNNPSAKKIYFYTHYTSLTAHSSKHSFEFNFCCFSIVAPTLCFYSLL